jgi:hypothetical protein
MMNKSLREELRESSSKTFYGFRHLRRMQNRARSP